MPIGNAVLAVDRMADAVKAIGRDDLVAFRQLIGEVDQPLLPGDRAARCV